MLQLDVRAKTCQFLPFTSSLTFHILQLLLTLSVLRKPRFMQSFAILLLARRLSWRVVQTLYGFSKSCSRNRKKKFFVFGGGFQGVTPQLGVFLADPGPQPIGPLLWLKIFSETRPKSASLKPLNDFLAYLQPKLWTKHKKLVKISAPSNPSLG